MNRNQIFFFSPEFSSVINRRGKCSREEDALALEALDEADDKNSNRDIFSHILKFNYSEIHRDESRGARKFPGSLDESERLKIRLRTKATRNNFIEDRRESRTRYD